MKKFFFLLGVSLIVLAGSYTVPVQVTIDGIQKIIAEAHCRSYCRARREAHRRWNTFISQGRTVTTVNTSTNNDVPIVDFDGPAVIQIHEGATYNELGASAFDPEDGDISDQIVTHYLIEGTDVFVNPINESTPIGRYTVRYSVVDSGGQSDYDERTIIVSESGTCFLPYLTNEKEISVADNTYFEYEITTEMSTSTVHITTLSSPDNVEVIYGFNGLAPILDSDDPAASFPRLSGTLESSQGIVTLQLQNECGSLVEDIDLHKGIEGDFETQEDALASGSNSFGFADVSIAAIARGSGGSGGGAIGGITQPFGGTAVATLECSCSGGTAFIQLPVAGISGPYFAARASLRRNSVMGVVSPGKYLVGTSLPGGVCSVYVVAWCFTFPVQQTVTLTPGVGTS